MDSVRRLTLLTLFLLASCAAAPPREQAPPSEARVCALCKKPIPAGHEVTLQQEGVTTFYRCPHCALTAQASLPGRSVLHAESAVNGSAIQVVHDGDTWNVEPVSAVFLSLPEAAGECLERHKAFTDEEEFTAYLGEHPRFQELHPRPYGIEEVASILAAGLPRDDVSADLPPTAPHVLVVGMLTHLPFKTDVLPAIEAAIDPLRSQLHVQFVDASTAPGKAILAAHGIHEHLPVVIFVNDRQDFERDGRTIRFRGFPGADSWSSSDLESALHAALAGH